jgi:hypothetical protein
MPAVRIEAVAERASAAMRQEAVLALPAGAVRGVLRVDVDVAPERVLRNARRARAEAVDGGAGIRERPVEVVEAPVGPVGLDGQHRELTRPMREMQLPRRLVGRRCHAIVGEPLLPRLYCPVRAVRGATRHDEPRQRRAVVRATRCPERLPVVVVVLAVPARVVELEDDLSASRRRCDRVHGSPCENALRLAFGRIRQERLALRVDRQLHTRGVPVDELRGLRCRCRKRQHGCHSQDKTAHGLPRR